MSITQAIDVLEYTYTILSQTKDLSPKNEIVNKTLAHTICQICHWQSLGYGGCLLKQDRLARIKESLPLLCARAETEMEEYWADIFSQYSALTADTLEDFWYYKNYADVVDAELRLMRQVLGEERGFSFMGAGPLPMTVLIAAFKMPEARFNCVDWDSRACSMADDMIKKLALHDRITVIHDSAQNYIPPKEYIPIIASLVENKKQVYELYKNSGIENFMVRDSEDIYEFIYRPADIADENYWYEAGKTPLCASRLNTTRFYRKNTFAVL